MKMPHTARTRTALTRTALTLAVLLPLTLIAADDHEAENLLTEPGDPANWTLELHGEADAQLTQTDDDELHLTVTEPGEEAWHVQIYQGELDLTDGTEYVVTFDAKADKAQDIVVSASQQDDPWEPVGLWSEVEVGQAYEEHELTFTAEQTMDGRNRVPVIAAGLAEGEYWFKNLKVVEAE